MCIVGAGSAGGGAVVQERPVLVVVGSVHPASRTQLDAVLALPRVIGIAVDPAWIAIGGASAERMALRIAGLLRSGHHCVLYTATSPGPPRDDVERVAGDAARDAVWAGERIAAWLGRVAARVVALERGVARCICTGGDTARAVLLALGARTLRLVGQVAPGVPVAETLDGSLYLVTKAGGFGEQDILARAMTMLMEGGWT